MSRAKKEKGIAVSENPKQAVIDALIDDFELRAAEEHDLLLQSNRELEYLKYLKPGQLPLRDGRIIPDEAGGIVWSKERQASLDAGRAKRAAKAAENEAGLPALSEDRIRDNKIWVNGIRDGSIAPTVQLRPSERGLCNSCFEPLEQEAHTSCRCWQCLKPAKQRMTQEKYDAALEKALGHPVPPKNCTCAPTNSMPIRCEDCRYRGSLRLFPNKPVSLRTAIIEPEHNDPPHLDATGQLVPGNLVLGRECLCRRCVDRKRYVPGAGRCGTCVGRDEWKMSQCLTGLASPDNPYRREQLDTEKEAVDFIIKDQNFISHENTRRKLDCKIVREQVQEANNEFFGCDVVSVQLRAAAREEKIEADWDYTEVAYLSAGEKERAGLDHIVDFRLNPANEELIKSAIFDWREPSRLPY